MTSFTPKGLTSAEARKRQEQYGKNQLQSDTRPHFFHKALRIFCEPMFLLLLAAAVIYFILGEPRDGAVMLIFVLGIITIDIIQGWKTDHTLRALQDLSAPQIMVLRDGMEQEIASTDLVPGDWMLIQEGVKIPADGQILHCSDLCIDESSLTGEAEGVWKQPVGRQEETTDYWRKDYCYAGTVVIQGTAAILVDKIGAVTEYGKIASKLTSVPESPTPLQKQTGILVKLCVVIAAALFLAVGIVTWFNLPELSFSERLIQSILSGITLAMAMIPEEFPVILTVFLSMGAWRMARKHSLVKRLPLVEILGSVSVLCVDKTGTITMNQMSVQNTWAVHDNPAHLLEILGLACEPDTYDPMEQAMLTHIQAFGIPKAHLFQSEFVTEYPFTSQQKMMGHVWIHENSLILAAKGCPERLLEICHLSSEERRAAEDKVWEMAQQGLRVIAVGVQYPETTDDLPEHLSDCHLSLCGLIGLADPLRKSVKADISTCLEAGIRVVMITGDHSVTAASIARQAGIPNCSLETLTGDRLEGMTEEELQESVKNVSLFSRVVPEHKMRIVKAFQGNGEIVAMTGDGVNDAPALKHADIGIAMGKHGSQVSREAADLILMDDNFSTIVDTIRNGRRIYDNIRKAIGYVFSIHIPIALASLLAPLLGIASDSLFLLPIHMVLLELVIDPTCSIVLERQPAESNSMHRRPRDPKEPLISAGILYKSLLQGFILWLGAFGTYSWILASMPGQAVLARSMGLTVLIFANLGLVFVNCSGSDSILQSVNWLRKDRVMQIACIGTILMLAAILYTPLTTFLKLTALSAGQILAALGIGIASVLWYEIIKWRKRKSAVGKSV